MSDLFVKQQALLTKLQKNRRNTATGMVHHYTDQGAMEAITKNGTLRMYDYASMADTGEIKMGIQHRDANAPRRL